MNDWMRDLTVAANNFMAIGFLLSMPYLVPALGATYSYVLVHLLITTHVAFAVAAGVCVWTASSFLRKERWRSVATFMAGGLLWALGTMLGSISGGYIQLIFTLGMIGGIGVGTILTAANLHLGEFMPLWIAAAAAGGGLLYCLAATPDYTADTIDAFTTEASRS